MSICRIRGSNPRPQTGQRLTIKGECPQWRGSAGEAVAAGSSLLRDAVPLDLPQLPDLEAQGLQAAGFITVREAALERKAARRAPVARLPRLRATRDPTAVRETVDDLKLAAAVETQRSDLTNIRLMGSAPPSDPPWQRVVISAAAKDIASPGRQRRRRGAEQYGNPQKLCRSK